MSGHGTILLAEDDDNDVVLIERALSEAGLSAHLVVARSSSEAILYLNGEGNLEERRFPHLLLLDWHLPPGGGGSVMRWLNERPELRARLAVVVLSALDTNAEIESAYALGINSYVLKPFGFEELVELLRQVGGYWLNLNRLPS